ncbi:glycosyltransferase family 2 protein [Pedobacter sp. MW01-1-1]|uniref:glycosyltransferase family 2 protein n=1 Tax=Pedobacter sp. MW01-1-1 TaxID=3383027 RepID=UPI003FF09266
MELISILVPCFNQGSYLKDCLNSILFQSHTNWECIIINDGSTDDTESIAKEYLSKDERFSYLFQENKGLSSARNAGIRNAKGSYIQLLDADDLLERKALETKLSIHFNRSIVYSSMRYFEHNDPSNYKIMGRNNFIAHTELKITDTIQSQKEVLFSRNPFVISAPLYPSQVFKEVGFFDEQLTALEDWDFHIRCINNNYTFHHHFEEHTYTLIRLHDDSMMRNQKLLDTNFFSLLLKHNLSTSNSESSQKSNTTNEHIKDFIPPIVLKIIRFFSDKFLK